MAAPARAGIDSRATSLRNLKRPFRRFEPVLLNKLTGHLHSLDKIAIDTPKNSRGSGPVRQVFYAMESWVEIDQGD